MAEEILLVDDESYIRKMYTSYLTNKGYKIISAQSGEEAIQYFMLKRFQIKLLIVDYRLPDMYGTEFIRKVRSFKKDIPIILISGFLDENIKKEASNLGIGYILEKPFTISELSLLVKNIMEDEQYISGEIGNDDFASYMEMCSQNKISGVFFVNLPGINVRFFLQEGVLEYAESSIQEGQNAFFQIFMHEGQLFFRKMDYEDPPVKMIDLPVDFAMLEAMRLKDTIFRDFLCEEGCENLNYNGIIYKKPIKKVEMPVLHPIELKILLAIDKEINIEDIADKIGLKQETVFRGIKTLLEKEILSLKDKKAFTILIIDDSLVTRRIVKKMIQKHFKDVMIIEASEGVLGIDKAKEFSPDIIFLDIVMPGIDGYEICREIRKIAGLKDTQVYFLTSKKGFFDRMKAQLVGANGYISKPFKPEEIYRIIKNKGGKG